jgi:hypothetical protein
MSLMKNQITATIKLDLTRPHNMTRVVSSPILDFQFYRRSTEDPNCLHSGIYTYEFTLFIHIFDQVPAYITRISRIDILNRLSLAVKARN